LAQAEEIARDRVSRPVAQRELRVAGRPYMFERWIIGELPRFLEENPGITPAFISASAEEAKAMIEDGKADLGFIFENAHRPVSRGERLRSDPLGLYAAPGHPAVRTVGSGNPHELARHSFIMPIQNSPLDLLIRNILADIGVRELSVSFRTQYVEVMKIMALRGEGIVCLLDETVAREVDAGLLVKLPVGLPRMALDVVVSEKSPGLGDARRFIAFTRQAAGGQRLRIPPPRPYR